jgi:TetR/AcrR family transcriptional repressor of bet genes
MARPSNTAERRREIVGGLLRVLPVAGYDGATIPEIARSAGLAPGLVHYHFESKLEILLAAVEELGARLLARFEHRARRACTPWERLDAFVDAHLALGKDADPGAVAAWVMIGAEALRHREVRDVHARLVGERLALATELVRSVLASEQRDPREARTIAPALLSAIEGAYQIAVAAEAIPRGSAAPMTKRMARGLVQAAEREARCR